MLNPHYRITELRRFEYKLVREMPKLAHKPRSGETLWYLIPRVNTKWLNLVYEHFAINAGVKEVGDLGTYQSFGNPKSGKLLMISTVSKLTVIICLVNLQRIFIEV